MNSSTKVAIFASSSGSNAQNIVEYFANNKYIEVALILCNNKQAYVLERAKKLNIQVAIVTKSDFYNSAKILSLLNEYGINFIVLAGFFLIVPEYLVKAFNKKIVNIHPSLLPKFGGKGFYGDKVHKAALEANEGITGITIHYVDNNIDTGEIIFQKRYVIESSETCETLNKNILALEHKYYPIIIERVLTQTITNECEL